MVKVNKNKLVLPSYDEVFEGLMVACITRRTSMGLQAGMQDRDHYPRQSSCTHALCSDKCPLALPQQQVDELTRQGFLPLR
jgi:hypothetical protein